MLPFIPDPVTGWQYLKFIVSGLGMIAGSKIAQKVGESAASEATKQLVPKLFEKTKNKLKESNKAGKKELVNLKSVVEDAESTEKDIKEAMEETKPHIEELLKDTAFLAELKKISEEHSEKTVNNITQGGSGNTQIVHNGKGDINNGDKKTYNIGKIDDADFS